jgi:hypothetical protein
MTHWWIPMMPGCRRHPEKKVEQTDCDDEVLRMNADLSSWWRCDRGAENQTEEDPEEKDDEQKGKESKRGVRIAPPKLCRFRATLGIYDCVSFEKCARHSPIKWCNPHWEQHAATLKDFEYYQQNAYGGNPEEGLLLSDRGSQVPTYLQTKFVSCRWNHVNTCFGCWQETVTQIDDQIIRDGLTNMQFVFKEQVSPKLYGRRSRGTFPLPSPRHLLFKVCFGSQTRHGRTKYHTTS